MVEVALLWFFPTHWVTAVLGVGLAVFAIVMALNPARFFRRMAGACLSLAGLAGAAPGIFAWVDIPGIAKGSLLLDNSPWIALTALVCGCFFGFLEYRTRVGQTVAGHTITNKSKTVVITHGDDSPAAGRDQVFAKGDAAGRDLRKAGVSIEHVKHLHFDGASPGGAQVDPTRSTATPVGHDTVNAILDFQLKTLGEKDEQVASLKRELAKKDRLMAQFLEDLPRVRSEPHKDQRHGRDGAEPLDAIAGVTSLHEVANVRRSQTAQVYDANVGPVQLPAPVSDFTGRDDELAELLASLDSGGATISGVAGMAGVGKTQLALELARRLTADYPDGQLYLDLRGADPNQQAPLTPAEAMRHVLVSFDRDRKLPETEAELHGAYQHELHGRHVLLLMDNAADRDQVEPMIPPDGCLLLVTSRQHFVLPGLTPLNLDTLEEGPARDLLLKICERTGEHAGRIAELCGRLPLALRMAASTLAERPEMTPEALIERLAAKLLEQLSEVDRAIAVSEAMLEEDLRGHFHALSVFPGSFEREAAAKVLELEASAADDTLDELVRRSLLQWDDEAKRYGMRDLVRLFADARLSDDRRNALEMRHARVYCDILAAADKLYRQHGEKTFEGLALFDWEWGNIQAGFTAVSARVDSDEDAARLCSGYLNAGAYCLPLRQAPDERITWLEVAVAAARRLADAGMEANHLGNLGNIFEMRGDLDEAEKMHRKSLEIEKKLGRLEGMASDYGNLGNIFWRRGDLDEAEKMHRKSLAIDEKLGRLEGMASQYGNLGIIFKTRGDLDEAETMYRKALAIDEKLGRLEGMAADYANLGIIFRRRGDPDEARRLWTKARDLFEQIGMPHMVEKVQGWLDQNA